MEINLAEETHAATNCSRRGGGRGLERITVNLTPRSSSALDTAVHLTGDTKTDTINRAVQIYAYLERVIKDGGSIHIRAVEGAEVQRMQIVW
jgi:hypothetical protein